jgi:hypothetical protein
VGYKKYPKLTFSAALISCVFILIGTAISSLVSLHFEAQLTLQAAHTANHGLLIAGRIITGFGSTGM